MSAAITQLFNWSTGRCYTVVAQREKDSFTRERFGQGGVVQLITQGRPHSAQLDGGNGRMDVYRGQKRK